MNYELAKKLKDAGFVGRGRTFILPDNTFYDWMELKTGGVMLPTLSELIEACGERFSSLTRSPRNTWYIATVKPESEWQVEIIIDIECSTPEEAVAELWLELNKK